MAQAGEKYVTQEVWWNPAQAVNFLRDGTTPSATDSWLGLPTAINETRRLNAAIQAGKIDVIELHLDDTQRQLGMEDKACMEIRFHLDAFVGGGVGVTIEVVDTRSDVSRPRIKTLLLRADNVRALLTGPRAAKHLITEEVRRRIAAGERWDSITRFSENLHEWMKTLYGVKPLAARTIANRLRDWKLWPLQLPKK